MHRVLGNWVHLELPCNVTCYVIQVVSWTTVSLCIIDMLQMIVGTSFYKECHIVNCWLQKLSSSLKIISEVRLCLTYLLDKWNPFRRDLYARLTDYIYHTNSVGNFLVFSTDITVSFIPPWLPSTLCGDDHHMHVITFSVFLLSCKLKL